MRRVSTLTIRGGTITMVKQFSGGGARDDISAAREFVVVSRPSAGHSNNTVSATSEARQREQAKRAGSMTALLLHLTALAAVAVLAAPAAAVNLFQYKTEAVKGASCGMENKPLGPFFIPNNQCSGVLYNLTQHCEQLELVKVAVTDYAHVKITIDDSLNSVSIERSPNLVNSCPGRAAVRAVLGCGLHSSDEMPFAGSPRDTDSVLPPM